MKKFIFNKTVDKSLLTQGFVIPVKHHKTLAQYLSGGALAHGEKRRIKIFFDAALHDVELASVDFDRAKYPTHSDIWRVLYGVRRRQLHCRQFFEGVSSVERRRL